jgi:hypothetical protein
MGCSYNHTILPSFIHICFDMVLVSIFMFRKAVEGFLLAFIRVTSFGLIENEILMLFHIMKY